MIPAAGTSPDRPADPLVATWFDAVSALLMVAAMGVCLTTRESALGSFAAAALAASAVPPNLVWGRHRLTPMRLHRAMGGITMAALAVVMPTMSGGTAAGHAHAMSPHLLALALVVAHALLSIRIVSSAFRSSSVGEVARTPRVVLHLGEVMVMGAGTVVMLLM